METPAPDTDPRDRRTLVETMTYEVVPMKGVRAQLDHLPAGSPVSVTCSPVKGVDATLDLSAELVERGHRPVPHLAARMVHDQAHLGRIVARLRTLHLHEVFVIAGDAPDAAGPYGDSMDLLCDLLDAAADHLETVGVAGYPDGHALIDAGRLRDALHVKEQLLADAGVAGEMSTQMCFGVDTIVRWLGGVRADGVTLPVRLGVPGVVDRAKLLTLGMRLGIGPSLRYLRKNRSAVGRLLTATHYDPDALIEPLADELGPLGIVGLHVFTFNQVETTAAWQRRVLAERAG